MLRRRFVGYPTIYSPYPFALDPEIIAQLENSLNIKTAENLVASLESGPRTSYGKSFDITPKLITLRPLLCLLL